MPLAWNDVISQPAYQKMPPMDQEAARQQYFDTVVRPQIPEGSDPDAVRTQFDKATGRQDTKGFAEPTIPAPTVPEKPQAEPNTLKELGGLGEIGLSGITGGVGSLADALRGSAPGTHDWAYRPRTEAGQRDAEQLGHAVSTAGTAIADKLNLSQAARDTLAERVPEALGAVGTVAGLGGVVGKLAGITKLAPFADEEMAATAAPKPTQPAAGAGEFTPDIRHQTVAAEGYTMRPSDLQAVTPHADIPGVTAENAAGSSDLQKVAEQNNQVQSTRLGARAIGKGDNQTVVTHDDVLEANKAPGKVYDGVGSRVGQFKPTDQVLGDLETVKATPTAGGPVGKVLKAMQPDADGLSQQVSGSDLVDWINEAHTKTNGEYLAKVLEDELDRQLKAKNAADPTGASPDVSLSAYRAARAQFAQNYLVRDAIDGGRVDANVIGRFDKANPGVLTGDLKTVARANDLYPQVTRLPVAGSGPPTNISGAAHNILSNTVAQITSRIAKTRVPSTADLVGPGTATSPPSPVPLPNVGKAEPNLGLTPPPGNAVEPPVQLPLRGTEQATAPGATSPAAEGLPPGRAAFDQQTLAALQAKHSGPSDIRGSGPRPTEPTGTNGPTTGQGETEGTAADFVRRTVAKMAAEGKLPKGLQHIEEKHAGSNARRLEGPK